MYFYKEPSLPLLVPSRDRTEAPIIDWQEIRNIGLTHRCGSSN